MKRYLFLLLTGLVAPAWAQKSVRLSGGLQLYGGLYQAHGIEPRNNTTPFGINGQVTLSLPGGVSLPFALTVGNQGVSFRQPFNQFGVSPQYKWITLHAGYRNVTFSPFTLAGHTFLGGGVELNPGKLRLGAVYGRFNKAIQTDLVNPDVIPAFQRTGYSVKIGYGTPTSYVDLVMLKAGDALSSVANPVSSETVTLQPAENMILGLTSRFRIGKRISGELDGAVSAYSRDIRSEEVRLEESVWLKVFRPFFTPRLSSQLTQALQAGLAYRDRVFSLKLQYKRIDPNFQSMGAYYFQSDIESYTVSPGLTLAGGKILVVGSYGIQRDNLAANKNARTGRRIGSLVLALNPSPRFGADIQFANYGITQQAGLRPVIDTLKLAQNNLSASANLRYLIQNESVNHQLMLSGTYQRLTDLNTRTARFTENRNTNGSIGYFLTNTPGQWGINAVVSYTHTQLPDGQLLRFYGPTIGGNRAFLQKKMTTSLNLSYLVNEQDGRQGSIRTGNLSLGYKVTPKQTATLLGNYLKTETGIAGQAFDELRVSLGYALHF
ncbi:MAG: hypothetical protein J7576_07455 [Siphonobacter aquaeclarae]|nr:hypothetical protein [Siphonobacter aquaeclarae]